MSTTAPTARLVSAEEAAAYLGMTAETIRRLARQGSIRSYKVGRNRRFDLDQLLEDCQPSSAPTRSTVVRPDPTAFDDVTPAVRKPVRRVRRATPPQ